MATYKKRGSKKFKNEAGEAQSAIERDSTTAEVFNTLDETASKSEDWVIKNQRNIFIGLGIIVALILAFQAYNNFVAKPNEQAAANELAFPKKYFDQATSSPVAADSLYVLGLEGGEGKYGFIDISNEFSGTNAGNLANYYAGISYLKMKKYPEAIEFLEKFSSDDELLGPIAKGAIGDAFADLNQADDAYDYYVKAANLRDNDFTTPLFLFKAANTAMEIEKYGKAQSMFERIKSDFPSSEEAANIDMFINKAKYAQ